MQNAPQKMQELMKVSAELRKINEGMERDLEKPDQILNIIENAESSQ